MNKKYLKIKFVDFWSDFNPHDNFIVDALSEHYGLTYDDNPDYLFFSCFGASHLSYNCVKILFVGENIVPDFNLCDYAIGFDYLTFGDRYLRLPLYTTYPDFKKLERDKVINEQLITSRKFCSIVVSNASNADPTRKEFFTLLSRYKQVDSGGRAWNNIGGPIDNKIEFLSHYKFNIAFENSSVKGYTTEKIMESMSAGSIPIYWGNPLVGRDFNERSFVNVHAYASMKEVVEYIIHLDSSDEDYLAMMRQPWLPEQNYSDWKERLSSFLKGIIEKPIPEAKYIPAYGGSYVYIRQLKRMHAINSFIKPYAHTYGMIKKWFKDW